MAPKPPLTPPLTTRHRTPPSDRPGALSEARLALCEPGLGTSGCALTWDKA